ncbi:N-acetylated-alpha-linked acidic dipeptidase 2-like isoform X3 [Ornithodoros turicata]
MERYGLPPFVVSSFSLNNNTLVNSIVDGIKPENIRAHLRFLASKPHRSGTERSETEVVNYIYNKMKDYGFDSCERIPYHVLHQYPDHARPNQVGLRGLKDQVIFKADLLEETTGTKDVNFQPGYLAFSASGIVEGEVVYVDYARNEDFDLLEDHDIRVAGHICIARLGEIHRGEQVRNCYERGGIGAILFLDPGAIGSRDAVIPKSTYDPAAAVQGGTLYIQGDPETPGYPSIEEALRMSHTDVTPKIPAQVISYKDAKVLLSLLEGLDAPTGFNATSRAVPFQIDHKGRKVRLEVYARYERRVVYDVIGVIKGSEEPDLYAITGNHHDAWSYGAVDPSSGTAALLEVARVLGTIRRRGWRPRRSIVFGFWAAQEMAAAGSQEFVEDRYLLLSNGAVSYTDVDGCTSGPVFSAFGSPSLKNILYSATKVVSLYRISGERKSLYDSWTEYELKGQTLMDPPVRLPYLGSENGAFSFFVGVPSLGISFRQDRRKYGEGAYPAYHTSFDTLHLLESYIDPDLRITGQCAQLGGVLTFMLAETEVIPYDLVSLGLALREAFENLESVRRHMESANANLEWLREEIQQFMDAARSWHIWIRSQRAHEYTTLRSINERMMLVERAFIKHEGLMGRPTVRHMAFSPSLSNSLSGYGFPSLHDYAFYGSRLEEGSHEHEKAWDSVRRHVNDIALAVRAARLLIEPGMII